MISGFLLIDKPIGITSFDIIRKLRRITGIKKMGHSGTLDPFASGLMIIAINQATRTLKFLEKDYKSYTAKMKFGVKTNTGDITGKIIENSDDHLKHLSLTALLIDEITQWVINLKTQTPPIFSAIKVNGKKAYELARNDISPDMKERPMDVKHFAVLDFTEDSLTYQCTVSAGTYIRTLTEQIAQQLGILACTESLVRTAIEDLSLNQSVPLESLTEDNWQNYLLSYQQMFHSLKTITISPEQEKSYLNGMTLICPHLSSEIIDQETVIVISQQNQCLGFSQITNTQLKPLVIFNHE